jgi:hypothetical protein
MDFFTRPIVPPHSLPAHDPFPLNNDEFIDFDTINIRGIDCAPADDFDLYLDSLPAQPTAPAPVVTNPVPLDSDLESFLYSPPPPSSSIPASDRRNRFARSASPSHSPSPSRIRRFKGKVPDFHLEALLNLTKENMDKQKKKGVDVREWEKFYKRMKRRKHSGVTQKDFQYVV